MGYDTAFSGFFCHKALHFIIAKIIYICNGFQIIISLYFFFKFQYFTWKPTM